MLGEKDDGKVVDGLYLAILNRYPTAKEREEGVKALEAAGADHAAMVAAPIAPTTAASRQNGSARSCELSVALTSSSALSFS